VAGRGGWRRAGSRRHFHYLDSRGNRITDSTKLERVDLDHDSRDRERVSAIAIGLIDLGWFRVGSDRYARESRTYGITTLTKRHVSVRGSMVVLQSTISALGIYASSARGISTSTPKSRRC
jgi:DNA topoisomerase IB